MKRPIEAPKEWSTSLQGLCSTILCPRRRPRAAVYRRFVAVAAQDTMEASPEAPNELAQLLERVTALPPGTHALLLRHLPAVELARLSCSHKALLAAWQELRRQHPGERYDPPTPGDLASVKDYPRLVRAGYFGDVAVIQVMVAAGVDEHGVPLEARSSGDEVRVVDLALLAAVSRGHLHAVGLLLDAGANVNARFVVAVLEPYTFRYDTLHFASRLGHADVVQLLIQRGADVHADKDAALRVAAQCGHAAAVQLLIQHGADVHANDDSALREASDSGHTAVVQLLIQHGADVHADEDAAMQAAAENGHVDVVQLLIQHGAVPPAP
jgi:hypothetical protein